MPKQTPRERVADSLYLLAAASDPDVFVRTVQVYTVAHSKTEEQVAELLRLLQESNPVEFAAAMRRLKAPEPRKPKSAGKPAAKPKRARTASQPAR